jgi:O-acetyl-ADP-ribose deacetylase (regulator of RNase III)
MYLIKRHITYRLQIVCVGIDYALSRIIFPNIESEVKRIVRDLGIKSIVGKPYLPIGSSIILDRGNKSLIVAPTMLYVSATQNAYYATMAVMYNILVNKRDNLDEIDILFTSLCCGYGKMDEDTSIRQIIKGINEYTRYAPTIIHTNIIIHVRNQPAYYQNTEFFAIKPTDIVHC